MEQHQQNTAAEDGNKLPGGHLNNSPDPETLRGLEQLAAYENMTHAGPPPNLVGETLTPRPITYEEPPGEDATEQERANWGLRALAAYDQM